MLIQRLIKMEETRNPAGIGVWWGDGGHLFPSPWVDQAGIVMIGQHQDQSRHVHHIGIVQPNLVQQVGTLQ